eukprot:3439365-Rhodomonas_salina.4
MVLCHRYALAGTELRYPATRRCPATTRLTRAARSPVRCRYAVSGNDRGAMPCQFQCDGTVVGAMPCYSPVLRSALYAILSGPDTYALCHAASP